MKTLKGKLIHKEGARKVIIVIIVFIMKIVLPMVMISIQYTNMVVHKKFLKSSMN